MTAEAIDAHAEEVWLASHTFYCVPLKAQITPAQCKANREKPTIKEGGKKIRNPFLSTEQHDFQPLACEGCLNWKHFCKEEAKLSPPQEENMGRTSGICQECKKEDLIVGRGLCKICYQKFYVRAKSKEGLERFPRIRKTKETTVIPASPLPPEKDLSPQMKPDPALKLGIATIIYEHQITVDFRKELTLLKIIKLMAEEEFRDPANQILWYLKCHFIKDPKARERAEALLGREDPHAPAGPA